MNYEKINKAVRDYPGLKSATSLIYELNKLIPFKEDKYEWLDEVIDSGILDSYEVKELTALVTAL
jgi:hypothetical protein